ncbi:MAG: VWA-like domain-containing protein [Pseudomonadota bacterium]
MVSRSNRAARALAHLPDKDPALATLALCCRVEDGDAPTHTQGAILWVGPEFAALPVWEQIGVIGHHVLHIAFRHSARMGAAQARNPRVFSAQRFNLAADAIVNEILLEAGHALPRPATRLSDLLDILAVPPAQARLALWDVERLFEAMAAASGTGRDQLRNYAEETKFREDLEPDATSSAGEVSAETGTWQGHLDRAMQAPGAAGRGVGKLLRGLGDLPVTRTPWERQLRALVTKALRARPGPIYNRPRNSWIAAEAAAKADGGPIPVFEPALRPRGTRPRIAVALDTSGSVNEPQFARFASEITFITRRTGAETHVLSFDEHVYDCRAIAPHNLQSTLDSISFRRDGGTSFVDVVRTAGDLDPSILVVLTDLDGAFGPRPAFPVIWAAPGAASPRPPFGRVLSLAR